MDAITAAPRRHPWLDRLVAQPAAEVRALAEGTADIQPYQRAEPSDAAATLLFGLKADDAAIRAFDQGASAALAKYRAATGPADRDQRNGIALAAMGLITVVQRLAPRDTVIDLHRRFPYWNAWAEALVLDRGLDLRREYWRSLALTQDIAAEAGLAPRRLLPFWLDICGEAGRRGRFDSSYLTVGLVGLRSLPLGEEGANEEAALHGLARWADAQRPAKPRFLQEWHLLEGAFPRDPTFWTDLVARVLASFETEIGQQTEKKRETFPAASWWREDVESVRGVKLEARTSELEPPTRLQREGLLADIAAGKPFYALEPRLRDLMRRHERYATRTGDAFYVVRTACNVGMRLLRGGDEPKRRALRARKLAGLALRFEPSNVFGWSLWRDALAAEGHFEAAELLGWETIRRFPESPQWRNQLAILLAYGRGRPQEAEALQRETIRLFPETPAARTQLAMLLADRLGREREAEALLRETLAIFKDHVPALNQLAKLVGREPTRTTEASEIRRRARAIEPAAGAAETMKKRRQRVQADAPPDSEAVAVELPEATEVISSVLPADLIASARMRRALFRFRIAESAVREDARREIASVLSEQEHFSYAHYVAAAAEITTPTVDDTVIAVAYLAAARDRSGAAARALLQRAQNVDSVIINMAGASRDEQDAVNFLKDWMREPANDLSPRDRDLRMMASRTGLPLPDDLVADLLASSLGAVLAA